MTTEHVTQTVDSIKSYMAQCAVAMQDILKRENVKACEQLSNEGAIDYEEQHAMWSRLRRYLESIEIIVNCAYRYILNNIA